MSTEPTAVYALYSPISYRQLETKCLDDCVGRNTLCLLWQTVCVVRVCWGMGNVVDR